MILPYHHILKEIFVGVAPDDDGEVADTYKKLCRSTATYNVQWRGTFGTPRDECNTHILFRITDANSIYWLLISINGGSCDCCAALYLDQLWLDTMHYELTPDANDIINKFINVEYYGIDGSARSFELKSLFY